MLGKTDGVILHAGGKHVDRIEDLGIILKTQRYHDRDLIVSAFTEKNGRISAFARNAIQSRRFGSALDPTTASELSFGGRSIKLTDFTEDSLLSLESAEPRKVFSQLSKDIERLGIASFFCEIVLKTTMKMRPYPDLFRLLGHGLDLANEKETHSRNLISLGCTFLYKLLQTHGAQPKITRCLRCELSLTEIPQTFVHPQPVDGGWACSACSDRSTGDRRGDPVPVSIFMEWLPTITESIRNYSRNLGNTETLPLFQFLLEHTRFHVPGAGDSVIQSLTFIPGVDGKPLINPPQPSLT